MAADEVVGALAAAGFANIRVFDALKDLGLIDRVIAEAAARSMDTACQATAGCLGEPGGIVIMSELNLRHLGKFWETMS